MDKTCWSGVGRRHRRGRRRWRWRPGRRWGRSWRVFLSSVMVLACLRACVPACLRRRWGSAPIRKIPPVRGSPRTWRGRWGLALLGGFHLIGCNTPSVTSNMMEPVLLAPFGVILVLPVTCRVARSARGRTRNWHLAPAASCYVRECCSAAQVRAICVAAGS